MAIVPTMLHVYSHYVKITNVQSHIMHNHISIYLVFTQILIAISFTDLNVCIQLHYEWQFATLSISNAIQVRTIKTNGDLLLL